MNELRPEALSLEGPSLCYMPLHTLSSWSPKNPYFMRPRPFFSIYSTLPLLLQRGPAVG
jgi:hypothetical protein